MTANEIKQVDDLIIARIAWATARMWGDEKKEADWLEVTERLKKELEPTHSQGGTDNE